MDEDFLHQARVDRHQELEFLPELNEDQLEYLDKADQLKDPITDGIGCEHG